MYKLLILDDESLVRRGIKALVDLEQLKITEVYEASNGIEGLALLKAHSPDLVLADINMPKMNGLDFAAEAKVIKPDLHIAILTGYNYFDYAVAALKNGVEDYILKPVSKDDVTAVLVKMIERLQAERGQRAVQGVAEDRSMSVELAEGDQLTLKESIRSLLANELSRPELSLVWLATELNFSSSYMSNLFKKLFGVAFQDYVLNLRLEKAKLLLLTTDMKNYEIAEQVGIEDVNYFGTRFKAKYGFSPKQYKEQVKGAGV